MKTRKRKHPITQPSTRTIRIAKERAITLAKFYKDSSGKIRLHNRLLTSPKFHQSFLPYPKKVKRSRLGHLATI